MKKCPNCGADIAQDQQLCTTCRLLRVGDGNVVDITREVEAVSQDGKISNFISQVKELAQKILMGE